MISTTNSLQAEKKYAAMMLGSRDSTINQKHRSQNIGPCINHWLGPYNGIVGILPIVTSDVP
jgi:hypothetical protein